MKDHYSSRSLIGNRLDGGGRLECLEVKLEMRMKGTSMKGLTALPKSLEIIWKTMRGETLKDFKQKSFPG